MITGTLMPAAAASRGRMMSTAIRSGWPSPSLSTVDGTHTLSRIASGYEYTGTVWSPRTNGDAGRACAGAAATRPDTSTAAPAASATFHVAATALPAER